MSGGDAASAVRYYHNALYAPWRADAAEARRKVRVEFIRFLLTSGQSARAESELVALATDVPDDLMFHLEVGDLFRAVGNHRRALDQFQAALRLAPQNGAALGGAGRAAFAIVNYPLAERYLQDTPSPSQDLADAHALVDLILSQDPLAARIGSSARRRRLLGALSHVEQRLTSCVARSRPAAPAPSQFPDLPDQMEQLTMNLTRTAALDNDTIEHGLELIDRGIRAVANACPPIDMLDRALMLIAERHGVSSQ